MNGKSLGVILGLLLVVVAGVMYFGFARGNGGANPTMTPVPTFTTTNPNPTPTSSPMSQDNVVEIALVSIEGDAGGETFGCGDSIYLVEREVGDTDNAVEAALEELFSVSTQRPTEGTMELYSALYNSDLSVDRVETGDNSISVYLTGEMSLGGTCDNPRFSEQLMRTVEANTSASEVFIYINDEPLDEAMSLSG